MTAVVYIGAFALFFGSIGIGVGLANISNGADDKLASFVGGGSLAAIGIFAIIFATQFM